VDNITNHVSEFFEGDGATDDRLWQYIQSMNPETMRHLSSPVSRGITGVMERNIVGMLGSLPSGQFDMTITTSRENLGRLIAAAMVNGYFLRNAEQRMTLEESFSLDEEGAL
jgi:Protein of unknown function (DUF760)